jgi:hypothetical protein
MINYELPWNPIGSLDPQPQDQAHDLDGAQVAADAVPANLIKVQRRAGDRHMKNLYLI